MPTLNNKIDFAVMIRVKNANPNGDPLNGNRPRTNYEGYGEISDVCIKRKVRDRLLEMGYPIFVQSDDKRAKDDAFPNLRERAKSVLGEMSDPKKVREKACQTWFDVRAFGQIFPFKAGTRKVKKNGEGMENEDVKSVSIGIRGPVSVQSAFSVEPIGSNVSSKQIVKSTSLEGDGVKRQPDQMGTKHSIEKNAVYVFYGSMNPQLAERTGFSDEDSEAIKQLLPRLFENDESAARPAGSMQILKVIWWDHGCRAGRYSSAKVHESLTVNPDGTYAIAELADLKFQEIPGF